MNSASVADIDREQGHAPEATSLLERYRAVRAFSESLCEPLATEDYVIQTMPDVSPTKWHLAHTTWFFERFILREHVAGYTAYREPYDFLFNSYYNTVGPMHCRPNRGLISRPTVKEVYEYRHAIDDRMAALLRSADARKRAELTPLLILGLNHEQQHQELMLTDLKHVFSTNPLLPAYRELGAGAGSGVPVPARNPAPEARDPIPARWVNFDGGVREIGIDPTASPSEFFFDNETPRHKAYLQPFALASRLTTNAEYLRFIEDGGYTRHELWLSLGFATIQRERWTHPIYWYKRPDDGRWWHYTLHGPEPVHPDEPVCHLSYFEADAFARWCGARLPTEAEWEVASTGVAVAGNFADDRVFHPRPLQNQSPGSEVQSPELGCRHNSGLPTPDSGLHQLFGDLWEWTQSPYAPYPGFKPLPGALGEYNGKFMCAQYVLRGGSCATSRSHVRATYRNFFPPDARWQFTGLRLAKDLA